MKFILLPAVLLATGIASAATPVDGWYTSAFGGYAYFPDNISAFNSSGLLLNGTSYNGGYNVGGRIGYQSNPIRYELEYTYLFANSSFFNINNVQQTDIIGSSSGNLIMTNLYYDFPEMLPAISPYLGVGMGYAMLQTTLTSTDPVLGNTYFNVNEDSFAYQGTAGLTYNFAENYAVNIAYRYTAAAGNGDYGKTFQAHQASVGVIYRFDRGYYK